MQINSQSDIPLYKQVSQILLEQINSGEWKANEKMPPEPVLCNEFNVSRITIRLALDELVRKGKIYRRQGKGTFVSPPLIDQQLSYFYLFNGKTDANSNNMKKVIIDWKQGPADEEQKENLKLIGNEEVFVVTRIIYANDVPFAVEESSIPVKLCPELTENGIAANGLYNSLDAYGVRPNRANESLEAIIIPRDYQSLLNESNTTPGFKVMRTSYRNDMLVEFCRSCVNGKLIKYNVTLGEN